MPNRSLLMSCAVVAMAAACAHQPPKQPAPAGGVTAAQPPAPPPAAPRRRGPPNPVAQDSLRRATVDSILRAIAGRENEPAGKVFKNVKLMATMSARAFLENMDVNYSRGLGWTCGNCHAPGSFDGDSRKNKRIARQMQQLTVRLNATDLPAVKELDEEYEKVTCVMCHRGSNEPKGTMPVPAPLATPVSWQNEVDELRRREALAREMGGDEKVKRQHDAGRLTVRERLVRLPWRRSTRPRSRGARW